MTIKSRLGIWFYTELGIKDKWINENISYIYSYGLMDQVSGRFVSSDKVYGQQYLTSNDGTAATFTPNGQVQYRFEQPVTVKNLFIKKAELDLDPNFKLKIEFLDRNQEVIANTSKVLTNDDYFKQFIKLDAPIENVYGYRLINDENSVTKNIEEIELFGDYTLDSYPSKELNIDYKVTSWNMMFYDEPNFQSSSVLRTDVRDKNAKITKGHFYEESKRGFRWYQISIPELGIKDKWINENISYIYSYGLMDQVSGRFVSSDKVYGEQYLASNNGTAATFNPNGRVQYQFEQPVTVKNFFIKKYELDLDPNFKLKIEFLDQNQEVIPNTSKVLNNDDFFKQFIQLDTIENVYGYRLINEGTVTKNIEEIELY